MATFLAIITGFLVYQFNMKYYKLLACSEKSALQALKASEWNLEGAFEYFYNQPPSRPAIDFRELDELYLRYKGWAVTAC